MSHPDEVIIERALENGWVQLVDDRVSFGFRWTGWKRTYDGGSTGYPVGTFKGPKWENGVKTHDGPYEVSWADAMRDKLDHDDRCGECGRWIEYGYSSQHRFEPFCFECTSWLARCRLVTAGAHVFVAATGYDERPTFYTIGTRTSPSSSNGYGGSWCTVLFLDERTVETCDLWCGGSVPERFWDRLPVTARLVPGRLVKP